MGVHHSRSNLSTYTIGERVQYWAHSAPDRELFVFYHNKDRDVYTSRQLFELAGKFANRLRRQYGFKPNDVIANTLPNSPERLITDLGIALAGCVAMNGQILLADGDDFFHIAQKSRCNAVIFCPDGNTPAWRLFNPYIKGDGQSDTTELLCERAPDMVTAVLVSRHTSGTRKPLIEDLRTSSEDIFVEHTVQPQDIAFVFTTSGSTGYSKLVPRKHGELFEMWDAMARAAHAMFGTTNDDVHYNDRLLGWIGGYPYGTYLNGEKRVMIDAFEAHGLRKGEDMWNAILFEKCSHAVILPLDIDAIAKHVMSIGGTEYRLKMLGVGGQVLRKAQINEMFTIAEGILICYGSTEGGFVVQGAVKDPDEFEHFYVGKPQDSVKVRIVDDAGNDCKPRQVGSVIVKGTGVFKGFYNRLEDPDPNTATAFTDDGWLHMEDNGFFDEKGNIYAIGRHKDIIMYGGVVLYPIWLETKIMTHPDVTEAWVVPVSDPVLYHNICACVKFAAGSGLTENTLRAHCERIFVADIENEGTPMPKYFMILEAFPQTATGKTDRIALRKIAEEKFGMMKNDQ